MRQIEDKPWEKESDRAEWKHESGLDCLINRNGHGAWCGYVAIPQSHPLYEKTWNDMAVQNLDVHGGITYNNKCHGKICHVADDKDGPVWWLGFDCAHSGDYLPMSKDRDTAAFYNMMGDVADMILGKRSSLISEWETYRDQEFVTSETNKLAVQLAGMVGIT